MESILSELVQCHGDVAKAQHSMPEIDIGLSSPLSCGTCEVVPHTLRFDRKVSSAKVVFPHSSEMFDLDSDCDTASLQSSSFSRRSSDFSTECNDESHEKTASKQRTTSLVFFEDGSIIDVTDVVPVVPGQPTERDESMMVAKEIVTRCQFQFQHLHVNRKSQERSSGEEQVRQQLQEAWQERVESITLQEAWQERVQSMTQQLWTCEQTVANQAQQLQEKDCDIDYLKAEIEQYQRETNDAREAMECVIAGSSNQARQALQAKIEAQEAELAEQRKKLQAANAEIQKQAGKNESLQKMLLSTCQMLSKKSEKAKALAVGPEQSCEKCGRECNCLPLLLSTRFVIDGTEHFVM
eukprot:204229-Rhodomonas_salina.1